MRDFTFTSMIDGYKFKSYSETCKLAARNGFIPDDNPDKETVETLQHLLDRTLAAECVARWMECQDPYFKTVGFFIYDANEQDEKDQDSLGITIATSDTECIIGVSEELLSHESELFKCLVLLHELGHAASPTMGHGDDFQVHANVRFQAFCELETAGEVRLDSRAEQRARRKPVRTF